MAIYDDEEDAGLLEAEDDGVPTAGALSSSFNIDDAISEAQGRVASARSGALTARNEEVSAQQSKREKIQAGIDALMAQQPNKAAMLFAMSSGFLKPSVTGNFFENVGIAAGNAAPHAADMEKWRGDRSRRVLEGQLGLADVDAEIAKTRGNYVLKEQDFDADIYAKLLGLKQSQHAQDQQNARTAMSARSVQEVNLSPEQAAALGKGVPPGPARVQVDESGNIIKYIGAAVTTLDKSGRGAFLVPTLQKAEDDDVNTISSMRMIDSKLSNFIDQITAGDLDLGWGKNKWNAFLNAADWGTDKSVAYELFKNSVTELVNESLRLNTGTQTESDARRAASAILSNMTNEKYVSERLEELKKANTSAAAERERNIDIRRINQGLPPMFGTTPARGGGAAPPGQFGNLPPGVTAQERR